MFVSINNQIPLLIFIAAASSLAINFLANVSAWEIENTLGSCHMREIELCCVGAMSIFQNPNGLPASSQELKRQCELLDESADCFRTYGEQCMTKQHHQVIDIVASELFKIEKDFCNSTSEMRKQYMKNVNCFRDVQRKYQRSCVSDLQVALEPIHKFANIGSRLSTGCCAFNRFKDCIMDGIEDSCGDETVETVQSWLTRAFGSVLTIFCRNYDPESESCVTILPKVGAKTHNGRNTSAISRVISSYSGNPGLGNLT